VLVQPGDRVPRGSALLTLDRSHTTRDLALRRQVLAAAREVQREQCAAAVLAAERVGVARALAGLGVQSTLSIAVAQDHQEDADRACDAAAGWVDWATVALTQAQEDDAATTVRAPFDAIVVRVDAVPGTVLARREGVVDLLDSSTLFVAAPFDVAEARDVHPGMPVRMTTKGSGPWSVDGSVRRIRPAADEGEGDAVVVDIAPAGAIPRGWATPGTRIDAAITVLREAAARIPAAALVDPGAVLVVRNGRVMKVAVEVGLAGGEFVEVTAGLAAGDTIVLTPLWPLLTPGMRVRPIDPSAPDSR
jgi:HlyD family secretion protein